MHSGSECRICDTKALSESRSFNKQGNFQIMSIMQLKI